MNNSKYLTPADNFTFLSTVHFNEIELYRKHRDTTPRELLVAVSNFDRSYDFTDDGNVWRNAHARHQELLQEIDDATEFNDTEKDSLRVGLTLRGLEQLKETFPELSARPSNKTLRISDLLESGEYSEDRIKRVLHALGQVDKVLIGGQSLSGSLLAKTDTCNKYSRHDLQHFNKVLLNKSGDAIVNQLKEHVTFDDIKYFTDIRSLLSTTVNVGTVHAPSYEVATLLPELDTYVRICCAPLDHVEFRSANADWALKLLLD